MALIQCHECKGRVSDHARTCPHCGAPVIATIKRRQKAFWTELWVRLVMAAVIGITGWLVLQHIFGQAMGAFQQQMQQGQPAKAK